MTAEGNVEYAEKLGIQIRELVPEVPEAGEEFAVNIQDRSDKILHWVDENDHVTDKQISSLENMVEGLEKWVQ